MHASSLARMRWFRNTFTRSGSEQPLWVLDVGSYDVNGTYRTPDFSSYRCIPADHGALLGGLQPCQRL